MVSESPPMWSRAAERDGRLCDALLAVVGGLHDEVERQAVTVALVEDCAAMPTAEAIEHGMRFLLPVPDVIVVDDTDATLFTNFDLPRTLDAAAVDAYTWDTNSWLCIDAKRAVVTGADTLSFAISPFGVSRLCARLVQHRETDDQLVRLGRILSQLDDESESEDEEPIKISKVGSF